MNFRQYLKVILFLVTAFLLALGMSYGLARVRANTVINTFDPRGKYGLEYLSTHIIVGSGHPTVRWRVAYDPTRFLTGNPVIVYVSLCGTPVGTEPQSILAAPRNEAKGVED